MGYRVKPEYWLKTESDKVEGIVLMAKYWSTVWTAETLRIELEKLGMNFTNLMVAEILDELKTRGVLSED